jgi:hypothetical protein
MVDVRPVADDEVRTFLRTLSAAFGGRMSDELVEILDDSTPSLDDQFFLHYNHPNTFEAEVLIKNGEKAESCACLFSAGYSAGWASFAFGMELHGREIRCLAKGDPVCEFIMAPSHKLEQQEARARATWTPA